MRLQITQDPASIATARATAAAAERAVIEGVFRRIADYSTMTIRDPAVDPPWIELSGAERGALRRNQDETRPRLMATAAGHDGANDATRLMAAAFLSEVDRVNGFRAVLALLDSDDTQVLARALGWLWLTMFDRDEATESASPTLGPSESARLFSLLGHHDSNVAIQALHAIEELKPPGMDQHLLPFVADPVLGRAVRLELARSGCWAEVLDGPLANLSTRGGNAPDRDDLNIVEQAAHYSPDPRIAARAREALQALAADPDLAAADRVRVEGMPRESERRDAIEAKRPADIQLASTIVERVVAAG